VFIQSLDATGNEVLTFGKEWKQRTPIFIAPTRLPHVTKKEFAAAGISHSIFANQGLRAAHAAIDRTFGVLAQSESAAALGSEISTVATVAGLVGAEKVTELENWLNSVPEKISAPEKKPRASAPPKTQGKLGVRSSLVKA
jgi:2-methylisocitrate lyase-like PEP mutase family enzyme